MSKKLGRPTKNKQTERFQMRLTPNEAETLKFCAEKLGISMADVLKRGLLLVWAELRKK